MGKPKLLDTPIKAYFVNLDSIIPLLIKNRVEKEEKQWFVFQKAIWMKAPRGIQYPASGSSTYFHVSPKDPQRPIIHRNIAYSVDEAIRILEDRSREQAGYYRKQAARNIEIAEMIETTDYRELVLGKDAAEKYVSPFTGKTK